mgnify:FL=1
MIIEKIKDKKVIGIYLLGVLLLSIGISYAYFTSRIQTNIEGSSGSGTTAQIDSEGIVSDGNITFSDTDVYPGHKAIASIKVTGKGKGKPLIYQVIYKGENSFKTPIQYKVYKSEEKIEAGYSCEKKEKRVGASKIYYEECEGKEIEKNFLF